mgnify:CR=1 FL=1
MYFTVITDITVTAISPDGMSVASAKSRPFLLIFIILQSFELADRDALAVNSEAPLVVDVLRTATHRRVVLIPDALVRESYAPGFAIRPPSTLLAVAVVSPPHVRRFESLMVRQRPGNFRLLGFAQVPHSHLPFFILLFSSNAIGWHC